MTAIPARPGPLDNAKIVEPGVIKIAYSLARLTAIPAASAKRHGKPP